MTTTESEEKRSKESVIWEQAEILACSQSPRYFLTKYVKIADKISQKTLNWQPWPYLVELLEIFENHREVIILKARQLGISWLVVAYAVWKALFFENVTVLFLSQTGSTAGALVGGGDSGASGKSKFIYNHLPDFMRLKLGKDNNEKMDFPANGSSLEALMSTENAGRSTEATLVIRDELEFHPCAEQNFTSIGPTVDAGGQMIDLSTPDKLIAVEKSHFKTRYIQAKNGENKAFAVFLPWHLRPVRLEGMTLDDWFEKNIKTKYRDWEVEQEYPATEEEALGTLASIKFFDVTAMETMKEDRLVPIVDGLDINLYNGVVRVYKPPVVGERYCIFTDPADGGDPFHTVVIKHSTGEGMCEAHGKLKADMSAKIHDELVRYYNNAYNSYEMNGMAGGKFDETIKMLDTPGVAPRRDPQGKIVKGKRAWWTGEPQKRSMLYGLEEFVRLRGMISHEKETHDEFIGFVIPEGKEPQATSGYHDDRVMAWAGVMAIAKYYLPPDRMQITSTKYKG